MKKAVAVLSSCQRQCVEDKVMMKSRECVEDKVMMKSRGADTRKARNADDFFIYLQTDCTQNQVCPSIPTFPKCFFGWHPGLANLLWEKNGTKNSYELIIFDCERADKSDDLENYLDLIFITDRDNRLSIKRYYETGRSSFKFHTVIFQSFQVTYRLTLHITAH